MRKLTKKLLESRDMKGRSGNPILRKGFKASYFFLLSLMVVFAINSIAINESGFIWIAGRAISIGGFSPNPYLVIPFQYVLPYYWLGISSLATASGLFALRKYFLALVFLIPLAYDSWRLYFLQDSPLFSPYKEFVCSNIQFVTAGRHFVGVNPTDQLLKYSNCPYHFSWTAGNVIAPIFLIEGLILYFGSCVTRKTVVK